MRSGRVEMSHERTKMRLFSMRFDSFRCVPMRAVLAVTSFSENALSGSSPFSVT